MVFDYVITLESIGNGGLSGGAEKCCFEKFMTVSFFPLFLLTRKGAKHAQSPETAFPGEHPTWLRLLLTEKAA